MSAASPPVELTRDQFLAGVRTSGVLSDRQFEKVEPSITLFQKSARDAADFLVKGDWLTRFQAERLLLGKTDGFLLGPYVILDPLAKTPAGRVFKARHRTMNRAVAVLVLRTELCGTEAVREGIRAQARSAARLAHANVLTLLDVNTHGDRMYLVHEYVCGTDAAALVRAGGPLSVPRACEFARQAADGLQHAHDRQTPHGRLTPAAVLVGRPGGNGPEDKPVVKVAGLGLGLGPVADGDDFAGYAAPELAVSPAPTPAADLYALGGVFHFLLTGLAPHPTVPITRFRPDLPPPLAAVLAALLHPDPARRPASASDVANALAAFAGDDSALIDFSLPSPGPISAATLPGASGGHLPVAVPVTAPTPPPAACPFAELVEPAKEEDESAETPLSQQAVNTPLHTARRRAAKRKATRRKPKTNWALWGGIAGAVGVLILAAASLVLLLNVLKS